MEDRHVVIHDLNKVCHLSSGPKLSYYAVFDGHAGIDAATYAASHLHHNLVSSQAFRDGDLVDALKIAFKQTDADFLQRSALSQLKSGCTAVCCLKVGSERLLFAWAGDSQAILVRDGQPIDLTPAHKPDLEQERLRIEEMGGKVVQMDTWRVDGTLAVSRAIGDPDHKPYVTADPDVVEYDIQRGDDFIVIACDGLWDQVTPEEATQIVYEYLELSDATDPQEAGQKVASRLVEVAKQQGSQDNITTIVIFLKDIEAIVTTGKSEYFTMELSKQTDSSDLYFGHSLSHSFELANTSNGNSRLDHGTGDDEDDMRRSIGGFDGDYDASAEKELFSLTHDQLQWGSQVQRQEEHELPSSDSPADIIISSNTIADGEDDEYDDAGRVVVSGTGTTNNSSSNNNASFPGTEMHHHLHHQLREKEGKEGQVPLHPENGIVHDDDGALHEQHQDDELQTSDSAGAQSSLLFPLCPDKDTAVVAAVAAVACESNGFLHQSTPASEDERQQQQQDLFSMSPENEEIDELTTSTRRADMLSPTDITDAGDDVTDVLITSGSAVFPGEPFGLPIDSDAPQTSDSPPDLLMETATTTTSAVSLATEDQQNDGLLSLTPDSQTHISPEPVVDEDVDLPISPEPLPAEVMAVDEVLAAVCSPIESSDLDSVLVQEINQIDIPMEWSSGERPISAATPASGTSSPSPSTSPSGSVQYTASPIPDPSSPESLPRAESPDDIPADVAVISDIDSPTPDPETPSAPAPLSPALLPAADNDETTGTLSPLSTPDAAIQGPESPVSSRPESSAEVAETSAETQILSATSGNLLSQVPALSDETRSPTPPDVKRADSQQQAGDDGGDEDIGLQSPSDMHFGQQQQQSPIDEQMQATKVIEIDSVIDTSREIPIPVTIPVTMESSMESEVLRSPQSPQNPPVLTSLPPPFVSTSAGLVRRSVSPVKTLMDELSSASAAAEAAAAAATASAKSNNNHHSNIWHSEESSHEQKNEQFYSETVEETVEETTTHEPILISSPSSFHRIADEIQDSLTKESSSASSSSQPESRTMTMTTETTVTRDATGEQTTIRTEESSKSSNALVAGAAAVAAAAAAGGVVAAAATSSLAKKSSSPAKTVTPAPTRPASRPTPTSATSGKAGVTAASRKATTPASAPSRPAVSRVTVAPKAKATGTAATTSAVANGVAKTASSVRSALTSTSRLTSSAPRSTASASARLTGKTDVTSGTSATAASKKPATTTSTAGPRVGASSRLYAAPKSKTPAESSAVTNGVSKAATTTGKSAPLATRSAVTSTSRLATTTSISRTGASASTGTSTARSGVTAAAKSSTSTLAARKAPVTSSAATAGSTATAARVGGVSSRLYAVPKTTGTSGTSASARTTTSVAKTATAATTAAPKRPVTASTAAAGRVTGVSSRLYSAPKAKTEATTAGTAASSAVTNGVSKPVTRTTVRPTNATTSTSRLAAGTKTAAPTSKATKMTTAVSVPKSVKSSAASPAPEITVVAEASEQVQALASELQVTKIETTSETVETTETKVTTSAS